MAKFITENEIEQIALEILNDNLRYKVLYCPDIAEGIDKERAYNEVVLHKRLHNAIEKLNPSIPADAKEEAFKKALPTATISLFENNQAFHQMLREGIDVKFSIGEGKTKTDKVWLIDFVNPN